MSDYSNLVQRLRGEHGTEPWQINPAAKIAADAIEALEKRIAELESALGPFANASDSYTDDAPGHLPVKEYLCRFRRARKVLGEKLNE